MNDFSTELIGQNYFRTREKLSQAIDALSELGAGCGINPARIALLRNLLANLEDPFLFVVVGEVNAGKSTLLNALFGEDFCSTDVIPTTDRIAFFKHGAEAHEFDFSEEIVEVFRPNEFLRDFNIVDTPGTNSIAEGHQQITEQFLPMADLVLFVFSVTNPWGASAWEFLDRIHNQWKKKIVFVLQQCDLRTEEEVSAILEHLQATAKHRFGTYIPTFAVSAKKAYLAKAENLGPEYLEQSNIQALEQYVAGVVESSEPRLVKLIHAWRASCYVLNEIKEKLGAASEIIRADSELLTELEPASRIQQERSLKKCEPLFEVFDQSFVAAANMAEPLLKSELTFLSAFSPQKKSAKDIEDTIFATTMKAVRRNIDAGADTVQGDVEHLWNRVEEEMQKHFNLELSVGEDGTPDWTRSRQHLCESIENATAESLSRLPLKEQLSQDLSKRSRALWNWTITGVLLVLAGLSLSAVGLSPWNVVCFAASAVFFGVAAVTANLSVKKIQKRFHASIQQHRQQLLDSQRLTFAEGTSAFFQDFVSLFDPLREVCQDHRAKYEPQLEVIENAEESLGQLERILAPVEKALGSRSTGDGSA